MALSGHIYYVVNDGNIVFASTERDAAEDYMFEKNDEAAIDEAEESGRDADDLTPEELAEFAFKAGYNGGYHYMDSIKIPSRYDSEDEFESKEGDTFTFGDLEEFI